MSDDTPILGADEVDRRMLLLAGLQDSLHGLKVTCFLARHQRLVLRYSQGPFTPSGLTNPKLHIFLPSGSRNVTTDEANYWLDDGQSFSVRDLAAAAAAIWALQPAPS